MSRHITASSSSSSSGCRSDGTVASHADVDTSAAVAASDEPTEAQEEVNCCSGYCYCYCVLVALGL